MSRGEFAEFGGLCLHYVILLETGKKMPPPAKWVRFAKILGATPLALLELATQIIEDDLPMLPSAKSSAKLWRTRRSIQAPRLTLE